MPKLTNLLKTDAIRFIPGGMVLLTVIMVALFANGVSLPVLAGTAQVYLPIILSPVDNTIHIADGQFTPHTMAVAIGTTIHWQNDDTAVHTLLSDNNNLQSPPLNPGDQFSWQSPQSGIYHYISTTDEYIEGELIVSENGLSDWFDGRSLAEVYLDSCSGCHGPEREGGIGSALLPGYLTENDAFYFDTIKNGRPATLMPAWEHWG